jgi:AcrR family transcriptional regulator
MDKHKTKKTLEQKILYESLIIIREQGLNSLSLRSIAKSLQVSHTAPYRHFESKEHLLAKLFEHGFTLLREQLLSDLPDSYDCDKLINRFYQMLENIILFASNNPDLYLFMFGSCPFDKSVYPDAVAKADEAYELLCEQLKAMQVNNLISKADIQQQAFFTFSAIHGYASLLINGLVEVKATKLLTLDEIKSYCQHNILRALHPIDSSSSVKAPFSY